MIRDCCICTMIAESEHMRAFSPDFDGTSESNAMMLGIALVSMNRAHMCEDHQSELGSCTAVMSAVTVGPWARAS